MPDAQSILALVDTSPVLLLPSLLACRERAGERPLEVALAGPPQFEGAMPRIAEVLAGHGIPTSVREREDNLETAVTRWLGEHADRDPVLDVSAASGGTAARAVLAAQRTGRPCHFCWFVEATNEVHFSNGGTPEVRLIDIGSRRAVRSPIGPTDFMAIFGLRRAFEDPYCGVARDRLAAPAAALLAIAREHPAEYRELRHLLGAARAQEGCPLTAAAIPAVLQPIVDDVAAIDGWIRREGDAFVFCGPSDTRAVFFLSGGWLEVAVAEAMRRALPEHHVQVNCGTSWGRKRRAEAEMDVAFVYHNALYLLSCKNEHVTERFFPHLDRFRALTAEFGESRTRPVLLSTAELEARHIRRCDAYEIGQISGRTLLELIAKSLADEPDALLKGLVTVSRGAPRAGLS